METEGRPRDLPPAVRALASSETVTTIGRDLPTGEVAAAGSIGFLHAPFVLQDVADYRMLLRAWLTLLRPGGRLAIEVPHAFLFERALRLPVSRYPGRKRLYTPASLLSEIEEALEPNSYRVRLMREQEEGYDIADPNPAADAGSILLLLERVEPPEWAPNSGETPPAPPPAFAFEPTRTRRETTTLAPRHRILILKLDHLGDYIMGTPALEKARETFPDAEITLVVGTWNEQDARNLKLFDKVVGFDAFPRNSSEERVDLATRVAEFERAVPGVYDLAIDLRTDGDTRFFLRHAKAAVRAGIGTRSQFDFLDIFLPIDSTRHGYEAARTQVLDHRAFASDPACRRTEYRLAYESERQKNQQGHLIWGPYLVLDPGEYLFVPHIEIGGEDREMLAFDVAIDLAVQTFAIGTTNAVPQLAFSVEQAGTRAEFRITNYDHEPAPAFSFYGGSLHKRGGSGVLHQSEYLLLLVELVAMRVDRYGLLRGDAAWS